MKKGSKSEADILRQKAETLLKNKSLKTSSQLSETETRKLIYELEVHQIELELRNEELGLAKERAELAVDKYTELYDFAPSGYFTLSRDAEIIELNLQASQMLGIKRTHLIKRPFGIFISDKSKPIFNFFLNKLFISKTTEICEVIISSDVNRLVYIHLSGITDKNGEKCFLTAVDITDLKKAELQLFTVNEAVEAASDAIGISDSQGRHVYQNKALSDLFEYETAEELEAAGGRMSRVKDPALAKQIFNNILHGKSWSGELEMITKSGRVFPAYKRTNAINDKEGMVIGIMSVITDITERKQSEKVLGDLIEKNPMSIQVMDKDGFTLKVNSAHILLFGQAPPSDFSIFADLRNKGFGEYILLAKNGEVAHFPDIYYNVHDAFAELPDKPVWIRAVLFPLTDQDGIIERFVFIHEDITKHKKAADLLLKSENMLQMVLDNFPGLVFWKDRKSSYLGCNQTFANSVGLKNTTEMVGKTDHEMPWTSTETTNYLKDDRGVIKSGKERLHIVETIHQSNGRVKWVDTSKLPMRDSSGQVIGIIGVSNDISKLKATEQKLIIRNKELVIQNEEKVQRAAELVLTNKELAFQTAEKNKHAADLIFANSEIAIQAALNLANAEKLALAELHQQASDRLQKIAGMVPGVIYQYQLRPDGSSCFPYASEAIREIYRVSPDEVREDASKVFANLHPDDLDAVAASIQASAKDLTPWQYEYRVKFFDGTIRSLYGNALPQLEEDGSILWHGFITDITDRKQAEEALRLSEQRWQFAIEGADDGLWDWNAQTDEVFFSHRWKEMLGYNDDEIGNALDEWSKRLHPDDSKQCYNDLNRHFEHKTPSYKNEHRVLCKDGTYKWILDRGKVIEWNNDGKPLRVIGTHSDITERKQMEEELNLASQRLELATRAGGIGVWDYDIVNSIFAWDNQMLELYGITRKDFAGEYDAWKALIHPDDLERITEEGEKAIHGDKEYDVEYRIIWPDGSVHNIRANAIVQRDVAGNSTHMIGTNWDITELRQAEKEKLDDSENRYRSIFQGSPDGILITDPETKMIVFANPAQCRLLGYTEEELKMMNIAAIHPEKTYQHTLAEFEKHARGEKNPPLNIQCLKKNGETFYADISSCFLDMNDRQYVVGFFRDITERREAEVSLKKALVKAESGNRLKTAFLQNISHEVRTPLNGILGFGNLLAEPDLTSEEKQEFTRHLKVSSDRLINTITDYINISLIATENVQVKPEAVNVNTVLKEVQTKFQSDCDDKNIALKLVIPKDHEHLTLITDPELLSKIISCLMSNAIKFTDHGTVTLGYSIKSQAVEFFVIDTGIGIDAEAHEKIFEPFVHENTSENREHQGSGLGLSIAKGFLQLLGGEGRLESEKGKGAAFFFSLPIEPANIVKDEPIAHPIKHAGMIRPVILLAEDDHSSGRYMEMILKPITSGIFKAPNGHVAVEMCHLHPEISLVFMDLKMPGMDGLEATLQIKSFRNDLPIIAVSAYALSSDKQKALDAGCDDFLSKPVSKRELLEKLKKHGFLL
ncbi:MAG: PAS domain S-box protein [Bacteroidota bacterium]